MYQSIKEYIFIHPAATMTLKTMTLMLDIKVFTPVNIRRSRVKHFLEVCTLCWDKGWTDKV